jgi:hypothetical protein
MSRKVVALLAVRLTGNPVKIRVRSKLLISSGKFPSSELLNERTKELGGWSADDLERWKEVQLNRREEQKRREVAANDAL